MSTLVGTLLQPRSIDRCEVTPASVVRIDDAGRFAEVGKGGSAGAHAVGDPDCWILPGLIDAHLHLPQWDRRGIDGMSLFDWHDRVVYPAEARFEDPQLAEQLTESFVTDLITNGTTTIAAFGSPFTEATDRSFQVFARRGYRAIFGKMLNDQQCGSALVEGCDEALDAARSLAAKWHNAENGRLLYAFSPRMPVCCSEQLMRGTAGLAKMMDCYIQTHVAESLAEVHAVRQQYPDSMDDVDLFAQMGLLTSRTLLGHGVFLSQPQRRQVMEAGSALVHCPTANVFLESGLMDYVAQRSAGVKIALGSSIAGGYDPFMPRVAVQALNTAKTVKVHAVPRGVHAVPTPAEGWWMLTAGAAEALSLGDRIGRVEPGYEADCLVVRPPSWIADLPADQQASALLYTLEPKHIEHVYIAGQRVGP